VSRSPATDVSVRFPPLGRLGKAFLVLLIPAVAVWLTGWSFPGAGLLQIAVSVLGLLLLIKLVRVSVRGLLWRVRNRMIVLFLFIGLVPLLLVTALVGLAGYVLTGQVAVHMATAELDRRAARLQGAATALALSLRASDKSRHAGLVGNYLQGAASSWPGLTAEAPPERLRGFRGILRRDGRFCLSAYASSSSGEPAEAGSVAAPRPLAPGAVPIPGPEQPAPSQPPRVAASQPAQPAPSLAPSAAPIPGPEQPVPSLPPRAAPAPQPGQPSPSPAPGAVEVLLLQPLTDAYLSALMPGLGRISFFSLPSRPAAESRVPLPPPAHRFDYEVIWGTAPFEVERWRDADPETAAVQLRVQTRPSAVFRLLFGQRVEVAQGVTVGFAVIGTLFLIVEMLSLVTGISITRTLTASVHQLYEGTQKVNKGTFSHRIATAGHDQLGDLSRSFNSMTESIERLIEESKERQRLASELQIAREVQEQLFPKAPPVMRSLEVLGVCNAARTVSGDYYDFVKLSDDRLALAIGDVAGKGIQGALLMASMQSMLRTQLSIESAVAAAPDGAPWRFPTAHLVSRLNVQLYQNTAPEKYATFFFGAWDDRHSLLTYTNAGHLPPIVIRNGESIRLDVNGLVVGAFPFASYEQSQIDLHPGDLLVAFTDGVTEPENEFAEEFGEQRLIDLLLSHSRGSPREIIDEILGAVARWTGRPELQDDMTLLVARRL